MSNVVSLQQHKDNNPKEAELHFKKSFKDGSCVLYINSPDGRTMYKHSKFDKMPQPEVFGDFIKTFKDKFPKCNCIDF